MFDSPLQAFPSFSILIISDDMSTSQSKNYDTSTSLLKPNTWKRSIGSKDEYNTAAVTDVDIESGLNEFLNPLNNPLSDTNNTNNANNISLNNNNKKTKKISLNKIENSSNLSSTSSLNSLENLGLSLNVINSFTSKENTKSNSNELSEGLLLTIQDSIIYTKYNQVYSLQELFGWKALITSTNLSSDTNNAAKVTTNSNENGNFDEECVVCLTEKKDIALLPCR